MNLNQFDWLEDYDGFLKKEEQYQLLQNPLLEKDIWQTVDDLQLKIHEHNRMLTINFTGFSQSWFKLLVKLYTLKKAKNEYSISTIKIYISNLKSFSSYLRLKHIDRYENINSQTFEDFDYYLQAKKRSRNTIQGYYKALISFFELCRRENWIDVNTYWFKGKMKSHVPKNDDIDYIPEEVWNQLEENLFHLPEPIQRMIIVIRTTGLRVGELLNLPFDCLRKKKQQWRMRFTTEKFNTEDEIPIPDELAAVIKEQRLTRPTRLTKLFEQGHDLAVVSAWAGHKRLVTTSTYYTHISCELIEKEAGHIQKALFNKEGKLLHYESLPKSFWENPQSHKLELSETHLNTPIYGYCGLSLDKRCEKFRACYTCPCFVATLDKLSQYIETRDKLRGKQSTALANGQDVLVEQFSTQADQLDKIIASLQEAA